jgi:PAS domain S-box-containing protein
VKKKLNDHDKTKDQLIEDLVEIRQIVAKLKTLENMYKQTEEKLRDSEEKYRIMVENANEPILVAQDGILKFANQKAVEVIGYQMDELTSRPFVDFIHTDDREIVIERHMKRLKGEEIPQVYHFRLINKNGSVLWAEINVVLIKWEEKPATLFLIRDITERKHTEELLKESEEKYSTIVEKGNDGIAIAQLGKIKFANSKLLELFGFSLEEILEKSFIDFIAPEYQKIVMEQYNKRIAGEKLTTRYELELNTKDSRKIPVEINASLIEYEGKPADLAIVRDISARKKVEDALRDSEARYRGLFESSMDGIVSADFKGNILECNQAFADIHGYSKQELLGFNYQELIPAKWRNTIKTIVNEQVIKRRYSDEYEIEHIRKDGTIFSVSGRRWLIKDTEGRPIGVWGIIRDITDRRRAEKSLRESEEKYRTLIEQSLYGVLILQDGFIVFANPAFAEIIGYTIEEVLAFSPEETKALINSEDRALVEERIRDRLMGKSVPQRYAFRMIRKDGSTRWIESSTNLINYIGTPAVQGVLLDITERKRAEESLRDSEEKFRQLAEQSPNMIFINEKGRIVYANKKCEEVMGYTREEFYSPDFDFLCLIAPECRNLIISSLHKHMKREEVAPYDYALVTKDGNRIEAIITSRLIDYNGERAILGIVTDITERKRTEEALEQRVRELGLLDKVRSSLTQGLDLPLVIRTVVEGIVETFGYTLVSLYLIKGDVLILQHQVGYHNVIPEIPITKGVSGRVVRTGEPVLLENVRTDPDFMGAIEDIVSEICVPLFDQDQVVGTLNVESTAGMFLSEADLRLMTALGEYVSVAIGNARLYEAAQREITERKKIESQLIESEKKYRMLIDQSLQGITILQDGFIVFANPAFAEICGYTIEELLNFSPEEARELVHPEDREIVQEWIRDRFMGKLGPSRYDFRITRKDGSVSWLDASVSLIEYQGKPANQVTFVDITKRKHAEKEMRKYTENLEKLIEERKSELKESEARYRGLYESSIDGIAFTDMEQKVVDCNQAFADMLGYIKEELYQLTLWDITPSKWFDMNKKIFSKQVFAKGYSAEYEKEYIKKDGTIVPISARSWVIKDKEGTPTGSWGIVRDITERKKVDQMQSQFINIAAHELRTPLSALKAHVDLLKIKISRGFWSLPEEVNEKIKIIARNADRLTLLINNLLDYTRLEAGTIKMNSELSSLENLAIETVKEVNLLAKKHNHEIKIITPESLPLMYLDKEKLKAIVNNLLSNAIKYTPKGGTINVLLTEVDDNIHIMVKDTGIGIAEDDIESIFLPFHVADVNTTDSLQIQSEFERTGLGLAITKEYVKMHGGSIWVESQVGEGSTFHVILPKGREN